jgi:hypothetical protein
LETALKETQAARRRLIVTDGVFSMDGDVANLPGIVDLAERYGAMVFVDDAHASGVFGRNGRGTVDHFNLHGRVHVQVGTLSKAIGSLGGYVASTQGLRELLIQRGRPFLFSTSHPPSVTAACIAALDVLQEEPELIDRLWDNTRYFKEGLQRLGLNTGASQSPITPVIAGEGRKATRLSDRLFEEGVFAQAIGYPTVPDAKSRVRTIVTATHTRADLDQALAAFEKLGTSWDLSSSRFRQSEREFAWTYVLAEISELSAETALIVFVLTGPSRRLGKSTFLTPVRSRCWNRPEVPQFPLPDDDGPLRRAAPRCPVHRRGEGEGVENIIVMRLAAAAARTALSERYSRLAFLDPEMIDAFEFAHAITEGAIRGHTTGPQEEQAGSSDATARTCPAF